MSSESVTIHAPRSRAGFTARLLGVLHRLHRRHKPEGGRIEVAQRKAGHSMQKPPTFMIGATMTRE
jgi:hypothetical protein